jgi:hypothetical protein
MTRIWESAVVIGLRDLQWKHARARAQFPDEYVSLGGNAERAFGDGFLAAGERLLLIEAKSTSKEFKEEWGPDFRKRSLSAIDNALIGLPNLTDARALLGQSMQCHFFAYWKQARRLHATATGAISITPYIQGVLLAGGFQGVAEYAAKALTDEMGLAGSWAHKNIWDTVPHDTTRYEAARAEDALLGSVKFVIDSSSGRQWDHLGLPLPEFQDHIRALIAGSGKSKVIDEPICAVVMSTTGAIFAHFTNTSQLSTIYNPKSKKFSKQMDDGRTIQQANFKATTWTPAPPGNGYSGP